MATTTLNVQAPQGQAGLVAELYSLTDPNTIVSSISLTEYGTNKAFYYGSVVDVATGVYTVRIRNPSNISFSYGDILNHTNTAGLI